MAVSAIGGSLRELFARFFGDAFGFGVGQAISRGLEPEATIEAQASWRLLPDMVLSPADLAAMVVQGVLDEPTAADEASASGINTDRFHQLFLVNGDPIAPEQALDLWNRGEIAEADVDRALRQSRLKPEWVDTFKLLRAQLVQIEALAEMVVQGVHTQADASVLAAKLGYTADQFDRFVRLAGNPPGPETLLEMWNRNITDEAGVDLGLVQSRLKPEWVDRFKQLRIALPGVATVVEARIKQRITQAQAVTMAAEHGIDEATLNLLVDAGGRPIAEGQALTLYRRGEYTVAQVTEAVARSNVRTEYAPDILKLATVYPSLFQIKQMLATGAISDELATSVLNKEGYPDDLIKGVIAAGHGTKLAGSRQLTQAAILDGYKTGSLTVDQATSMLEGLGYDAADVGLLIGYADYENAKTLRTAVVGVVKARYLQSDIDENTASNLLDSAGIPPTERDQYLQLWTFDVQSNPRLLTLAECNRAVKLGVFDEQQYRAYLPRLNYQQPEIDVLVALYVTG